MFVRIYFTMYKYKKEEKPDNGKVRKCNECGSILPESSFYGPSVPCNECAIKERHRRDKFYKFNNVEIY
jgi:NAD-dependent SIR2 family protein deacetylase